MYGKNWQYSVRRTFLQGGCPATISIIAVSIVLWFLLSVTRNGELYNLLVFRTTAWPAPNFWTVLTWPYVVDANPIFVLFAGVWAYIVGGSLERSWGTKNFALFWAATTAITAASIWLGSMVLHTAAEAAGLWLGLAPATVAWCLLNRRETVRVWMVLPIQAIWLAWLTPVVVWYEFRPLLGLFAIAGCAAAYWYVVKGRGISLGYSRPTSNYRVVRPDLGPDRESTGGGFSISKYLRDRRERRRLEDLFRRSGIDTDEKHRR